MRDAVLDDCSPTLHWQAEWRLIACGLQGGRIPHQLRELVKLPRPSRFTVLEHHHRKIVSAVAITAGYTRPVGGLSCLEVPRLLGEEIAKQKRCSVHVRANQPLQELARFCHLLLSKEKLRQRYPKLFGLRKATLEQMLSLTEPN